MKRDAPRAHRLRAERVLRYLEEIAAMIHSQPPLGPREARPTELDRGTAYPDRSCTR
jgi:hypothetical protein